MDKQALRREVTEKKRALTEAQIDERSARLADRLFRTECYRSAESLYAYLSFNQEVRTGPVIRRALADGKRVAVPKVMGSELAFFWIGGFDTLREGHFGILEPAGYEPLADDAKALVLLPGLAFDPCGHRVGYGGGFYDRFLAAQPGHPTVALCYGFQLYEHLETDPHDVAVDLVISDD